MRSLTTKALVVVAVLIASFSGFAPSGDAQDYPPVVPAPTDCASVPLPSVQTVGTSIVLGFAQGSLTCISNVLVEVNPVLYNGPPPVSGTLTLPIPALAGDDQTVTVTVTYANGQIRSTSAKIGASVPAAAGTASAGAPSAAPSVATAPVPAQDLAFTGTDINLPLAAGAVLVGSGGLVLLAARKREKRS